MLLVLKNLRNKIKLRGKDSKWLCKNLINKFNIKKKKNNQKKKKDDEEEKTKWLRK